jgi:large subunit ribosomal protein L25
MQLTAKKRINDRKSAIKQMRREGNIPGVFYAPGKEAVAIEIDGKDFEVAQRSIKQGRLATSVFTLTLDGKKCQALVKGIQYDLTSYRVIHLDLLEWQKGVPVHVMVPVDCVGVAECVGIKLGGFLRQVIRAVEVECTKEIPPHFEVDVRSLGVRQSKRLSDIAMPSGVKPVGATDEVVVVIAKR